MTTETPNLAAEGSALSGVAPVTGAEASSIFSVPPVKVGLYRTEKHDYYLDGQGPYPSVTTILRVLHKPSIEADLKLEVARHALADARSGDLFRKFEELKGDESKTVAWMAEKGTLKRDAAASFGTMVHGLIENAPQSPPDGSGGFPLPDGALPVMEAYQRFLGRSEGLEIISREHAIFNLTEGYAGTYDFLGRWTNPPKEVCSQHSVCLWLFDVKSGKSYYPDFAFQLEAYRRGEFISLPNDPTRYPMPHADHVAVLHLRPDKYPDTGYRIVEYVTGDRDWIGFLAALNLHQWHAEKRFLVREGRLLKHS